MYIVLVTDLKKNQTCNSTSWLTYFYNTYFYNLMLRLDDSKIKGDADENEAAEPE